MTSITERENVLSTDQIKSALDLVRAYLAAPKNPDGRTKSTGRFSDSSRQWWTNIMKTNPEPVVGQCKLCLKQKQLHESHLMPHALYAPGKKGFQYATRTQSGQNPEHLKAHLLCFDCEQRFNRLGESEVLRWLAPKARKQFPLHDRLRVALPCGQIPPYSIYKGTDVDLDTEKFTYFTLSVAWRRSIHDWMNFDGTPLPPWNLGTFGEQMRTFLSGESGFPPDTAVMVIVCSDTHSREFWTAPSSDVVCNCLGMEFSLAGSTSGH